MEEIFLSIDPPFLGYGERLESCRISCLSRMFPVFLSFLEGKIGKIVEEFEVLEDLGIEMSWVLSWVLNKVSDGGGVRVEISRKRGNF